MGDLPPKLFFRIGEVAGLVGVEPHVLRYWEREFRSIRPTKSAKGQRVYSRKDVENLLRVRDLLYRDGFTIAGAKKRLHHGAVEVEVQTSGAHGLSVHDVPSPSSASEHEYEDEHEADGGSVVPSSDTRSTREKLVALRDEVEAFLDELSTTGRR